MKKTAYLIFALAILSTRMIIMTQETIDLNNDQGQLNITTVTNDDPNSCLVTISLELFADRIQFNSTIITNPVPDCTHHDLKFQSYFRGDNLNSTIPLVETSENPNISTGALSLANITELNGTACMSYGYLINGLRYYGCRFRYNDIYFTVQFGLDSNGSVNTSWYNLFNPSIGTNLVNLTVGNVSAQVWKRPNESYPDFQGRISSACDNYNNNITSLDTEFIVNGEDNKQSTVNLQETFGNSTASPLWVRKRGNDTSQYIAYRTENPYWNPFSEPAVNSCSNTGKKYSDFLPDLNYCQNPGCDASFALFSNGTFYILQTNGFATVPARRLRL